jgi:TP901 family phage tail tape measure protein
MADTQSNIQVSIDTTQALASIKNLQRQISAFHSSMAKGGAAANAVSTQLQQTLINSVNATGQFSAGIRTIRTTTESFTSSLEKNKFSLGEYFRYAGGATKTFGRLFKTEHDTINKVARENVKDLQTQYIRLGRDASGAMKAIAVRPLALDMNDLATRTQIAAQKQAIFNQLLKQGSTNLLNFGKNTQWAGRQLMVGFTLPLIAVGSAAAKTFMDMETQAIRFKKVYGDLFTPTGESQQALKDIQELGKEFTKYGIAVSTTVGLAAEAAAAGFKGVDLQRQTTAATRLSILGQVESQKALETTISLQNAFSMSSENLAESIDFLNAVENQTVLSLDDISTAIPKAAPIVQQLGGDVKDLAFLMTAMKEGGINASEGANALKSGLASLINPTGKANDMLLSFGINAKKIVVDNKGDLKKTVVEFATALNQLDPLNRAQAIEQMFGKFQFSRLSTLFANVTKEGTQASRVLDLAGASVQELATLSEKELGMTSESAMNKFKGAIENLKMSLIPLGEQFLKAVTPIAEFITKILSKFEGLSDNTKKIIVVITGLVAGLGPVLLMTVGLVMNGLANMIKLFAFLKSAFNRTGRSTATLGTEVQYMTTEQRNAAAVAASLDQVHTKLAQTFTSEATAVNALTRAYQRAIAAQSQFVPVGPPLTRGPISKFADGRPITVGGTGNKDSELALLMPGETVIPTAMSKKYGPLINAMIAGNIPEYEFGKEDGTPGVFSFGGREFPVSQRSIPSIQRIIAEAQSLSGVIENIDDVIFQALDKLASGLEGSAKITAGKLKTALSPVTDLARSTFAKQQAFSGNAGAVMAHGLPKTTLTPEQVMALEQLETGTTFGSRLAGRSGGPVTGLSNMVFPMPAGFNQDRMTGAEGAQWIGQNRTRFTADIAAQAGLDPNHPDLLRFGTAVGKALKSAAYRGVVVTQDDFERIISDALETEIFAVGKNTSAAVKTAFADAKRVSTIMYPSVSGSGRESFPRVPVPEAARGTTVAGLPLASGSSYKNRSVDPSMNVEADKFTMKAVRARVRRFFSRMPKEVEEEVKTVLDISSPSRKTRQLGNDTATGFVSGVAELNDDAKAAGRQVGSSLVDGATQSGRARRVATRAQGPAPIGATPQPGMRILPIVPPGPRTPPGPGTPPNSNNPIVTQPSRFQGVADRAKNISGRMNSFGGGMGLMGVNMGLSMLPDFGGKGIVQGGLAGANLGMFFGPPGMAIGATIGTITSAVSALIEKQKQLKAMNEATFKSSADVATFFGNKVVDTTIKMGSLSSSILRAKGASDGLAQSFGYTNEELSRFISLVESLPEDNPLKQLIEGLKDEDNPDKINEIAKAFITTQVALGQLKPDQAQKQLDLILGSINKLSMIGSSFINLKSQTEAITITLKAAASNSANLGTSLIQLVGAASNSTSLTDMTAIIDGISAAGLTAAQSINAMRNAFLGVGNTEAAQSVTALERIPGIQGEQIAYLLATATRGFRETITSDTNIKDIMEKAKEFNDNYFKQLSGTNVTETKAYQELEKETAASKKQIDLLKKKKKAIDDQIKQQEKITSEIKRQNDYLDKQRSLDKSIVEAKIRGDYIGAASLLQEKTQNTVEFNQETEKAKLQAKSDALQDQIDALQLKNDELVDAINASAATQSDAMDAAATKIIDGLGPGGFDIPEPKDLGSQATDTPAPKNTDKIGGPTGNQTTRDQKTGEKKLLEDGIFQTRLVKFANNGRTLKAGDIVQVGPFGDIPAVVTDDILNPKKTGTIEIIHVDKNQGIAQFRVHAATGGMIRGAGTPTSDSIPALLSNGEYVVKAKSVKKYGVSTLDALNAGRFAEDQLIPGFRFGGLAGKLAGGIGKLFSNIIPKGLFSGLSKSGNRIQPNTGSADLPTPTPANIAQPLIVGPSKASKTILRNLQGKALEFAQQDGRAVPEMVLGGGESNINAPVILGRTPTTDLSKAYHHYWSKAYSILTKQGDESVKGMSEQDFLDKLRSHGQGQPNRYDVENLVPTDFIKAANKAYAQAHGLPPGTKVALFKATKPFDRLGNNWSLSSKMAAHYLGKQHLNVLTPDGNAGLYQIDVLPEQVPTPLSIGAMDDEFTATLPPSLIEQLGGAKRIALTGKPGGVGANRANRLNEIYSPVPGAQPLPDVFKRPWELKAFLRGVDLHHKSFNINGTDDLVKRLLEKGIIKPKNLFSDKASILSSFKGPKLAKGGKVLGRGTATSDSIPAYLSNGEYVIKADSVKKYGVGTMDALNSGKFANGGLMQRFKNGVPAFADGGLAKFGSMIKTMGKFGISGGIWQAMEEGEKWLSLKHGANENSSGIHKWSKAIARALYSIPQGAASGVSFGLPGLLSGAGFGLIEGLIGLGKSGSQFGVKGGTAAKAEGFNAKKELDAMSFKQSGINVLQAFAGSAILGPLINLLPKGIQKAVTTKLGQNIVSAALIGIAPPNPVMGFSTPVKPLTSSSQKLAGSAVEKSLSGSMGSKTFAGSVNTIENQIPVARTSDDVSKALVDDMFASAMSVANAAGRYAPNFLGRNMEAREGAPQFSTFEEIDPLADDVTKWPWESNKPSQSPVVNVPTIIDKLSLKQRRMIAYLAGKKSSLVGVPSVTNNELDSGYNWYYKQFGDEALDWDTFKAQKLASVGLKSPSHKKFSGYVTDTRAFETLHENDVMTPRPGENNTTTKKFSIGEQRQSDEFDRIYGTNNYVRRETPLMDDSDYGAALRLKFDKVYDELIRRGYIRKAWYDAKGKRHEQKATAPLPEDFDRLQPFSPFLIQSADSLHGPFTPNYAGKALTRYEFYKAVAATLPGGMTSSKQASNYAGGGMTSFDRPTEFTRLVNQIYAEQHGLTPGEKIKFWKYDLYGSPLKNKDGEPAAAGYYTLDKGMAYSYARGRTSNVTQEELDSGSQRIFGGQIPESRGAYYVELYPHEIPQVLGLGGLKDEMAIVIGERLAKEKSVFTGMAKADEYQYDVDPGAIRGLSPWKMYAPGEPWKVESPKAVFGVPLADSAKMAQLLNSEQLSLRLGGKKEWTEASVSQVLKDAAPYITMDGSSRFVAQDAIPQNWGSDAELILERMLKAQEMYNLIRTHIQNLPKVELLKTLSKQVPRLATGGLIKGPGTGTSDSIRASLGYAGGGSIRVSNGEYVVKASSVRDYGVKTMDAINNGTATVGANSGGTVYNINMPVTSNNANPEIVANEVMRKLKLEISKNNKSNKVGS